MTTKVKMQLTKKDIVVKEAIAKLNDLRRQVDDGMDREDAATRSICVVYTVLKHLGRKDVVEAHDAIPSW